MNLLLRRDFSNLNCTLGTLRVVGFSVQTLERPWLGNQKGISCVPKGVYQLFKHSSEAHPKTWALVNKSLNVLHWPDSAFPDARTAVLIHPANYPSELRGCIAPGMSRGVDMVNRSREAMRYIMDAVPWTDEHTLEIV
jgi:hypothetical protein